MTLEIGSRLAVGGGYDMVPGWLPIGEQVTGSIAAWLTRPGQPPACLVRLDKAMSAEGLAHGKREDRTGDHLLLTTRYKGQDWDGEERTVHVSLCAHAPGLATFDDWVNAGVWIESHATYTSLSG